jgi:hypothetical protein
MQKLTKAQPAILNLPTTLATVEATAAEDAGALDAPADADDEEAPIPNPALLVQGILEEE